MRYMQIAPLRGEQMEFSWETKYELSAPGNGEWILIPKGVSYLAYTISPEPIGEGRVEITTDIVNDVRNGLENPVSWPSGNVQVTTQDASIAITAFRLVVVSGSMKLTVRAT